MYNIIGRPMILLISSFLPSFSFKKARQSDDLEVQLKSNTTLRKSPMKYAVSSKKEDICLKDLTDKPKFLFKPKLSMLIILSNSQVDYQNRKLLLLTQQQLQG